MSFDDIINKKIDPNDQYICAESKTCDKECCLHKTIHSKDALGRPEQPEDTYEYNWDCTEIECSRGGSCIPCSKT